MSKIIVIPALGTIVALLGVIAGIMVHRHDRRVDQREWVRQNYLQGQAYDCNALLHSGLNDQVCNQFFAKHPDLKNDPDQR